MTNCKRVSVEKKFKSTPLANSHSEKKLQWQNVLFVLSPMAKGKDGTTERKTIELKEREENRAAAAEAKRAVQKANEARAEEGETNAKAARIAARQQKRKRPCNTLSSLHGFCGLWSIKEVF